MAEVGVLSWATSVDDDGVERGLAKLRAEVTAAMADLEREDATVEIKANISELERDLVKARKQIAEHKARLVEAEEDHAAAADKAAKKRAKSAVDAIRAEIKEEQALIGLIEAERKERALELKEAQRFNKTIDDRRKSLDKVKTALDKEAKAQEALRAVEQKRALEAAKAERDREIAAAKEQRAAEKRIESRRKEAVVVERLRTQYAKLDAEMDKLNRKKRRSDLEAQRMRQLGVEMDYIGTRIKDLGGNLDGLDVDVDENRTRMRRWGESILNVRLHLGFMSLTLRQFGVVLATLGPAIEGVIGLLSALVGVGLEAVAGAALAGAAGLGAMGVAAIGIVQALKPAVENLKDAWAAQEAYNDAVLKYGRNSDQAKAAQEKLTSTLRGIHPAARTAVADMADLRDEWDRLTEPTRNQFFRTIASGVQGLDRLLPTFARATNQVSRALGDSLRDSIDRLSTSPEVRKAFEKLMGNFAGSVPSLIRSLENLAVATGNVFASVSRHFGPAAQSFQAWTGGLRRASGETDELNRDVDGLMDSLRSVWQFLGAGGRTIWTFFTTGADEGRQTLDDWTRSLNNLTQSMRSPAGQEGLRSWFEDTVAVGRDLLRVFGNIGEVLLNVAEAFRPVMGWVLKITGGISELITTIMDIPVIGQLLDVGAAAIAINMVGRIGAAMLGLKLTAMTAGNQAGMFLGNGIKAGLMRTGVGLAIVAIFEGLSQKLEWLSEEAAQTFTTNLGTKVERAVDRKSVPALERLGGKAREAQQVFDTLAEHGQEDLAAMGDEAGKLADRTERAMDRIRASLQPVRDSIHQLRVGWFGDLDAIRDKTNQNLNEIRDDLGIKTKEGRRMVERNFAAMRAAIKRAVDQSVIDSDEGHAAIRDSIRQQLKIYGITGMQAEKIIQAKSNEGGQHGLQRGGPITTGAPSGDSVPTVLERGEYVLNRKAVSTVGRNVLDRINFRDAPRMAAGGIVGLGRQLLKQGYQVGEHPAFGGVQGSHAPNSYHYRGMAIDVNHDQGGEVAALDRLYARLRGMPGVVELLWQVADHYDHLHVAMSGGGSGLGFLGGRPDIKLPRFDATAAIAAAGAIGLNRVSAGMEKQISERVGFMGFGQTHGSGSGMGVMSEGAFLAVAKQALRMTEHFSATMRNANKLLILAKQESSLNPNSINNWDSNAQAGNPSGGLMHTTESTFRAYHEPGTASTYFDPLASIAASINYQKASYGSLVTHSPYASGGLVDHGGAAKAPMFMLGETHPEFVISTNPSYRDQNVDYLMQAAQSLGVVGYAKGKGWDVPRKFRMGSVPLESVERPYESAKAKRDRAREKLRDLERQKNPKAKQSKISEAEQDYERAKEQYRRRRKELEAVRKVNRRISGEERDIERDRSMMEYASSTQNPRMFEKYKNSRLKNLGQLGHILARAMRGAEGPFRTELETRLAQVRTERHQGHAETPGSGEMLTRRESERLARINRDLALAALTEPLDDDVGAQGRLVTLWESVLGRLRRQHAPPEAITEAAQNLLSAREGLESLQGGAAGGGAAISEQFAGLNKERFDLLTSFGSNVADFTSAFPAASAPGGASFPSGPFSPGSGSGFAPAGSGAGPGGGGNTFINNFAAPPPDPHTWTRSMEWEAGAVG
jgi:SLT domain-containing protein